MENNVLSNKAGWFCAGVMLGEQRGQQRCTNPQFVSSGSGLEGAWSPKTEAGRLSDKGVQLG